MANTDKDILITPNIGSSNDPKIEFKGASSTVGPSTITATIYPLEGGTLSFDGSQGSLFSISNNLTSGSIFSVNPISGIPIIDINADRTIALNPYGGNTGIGLTNPSYKLDVNGSVGIRNTLGISESGASGNRLLISTSASGAVFNQNDNSNILFQTQGATRFTIAHSSGDVTATGTVNATALVITGGRVTVRTGGVNTYGIVSGYDNNNHLMTMRASISGSTSSPTLTAGHYMCFVEYAGVNDFEGWYFKSSSSGSYEEIARITRTNITYNGNIVLHAGNYNSYAPTLTGTGASGTWGISITGNAATATTFSTNRTNYKNVTDNAVAGQLMWKAYGNNHTIFDASAGSSPDGGGVNQYNPTYPVEGDGNSTNTWGVHPVLMGWNGSSTFGVKVDFARTAHQLNGQTASYYLDTSATAQTKSGNLTVNGNLLVGSNTYNNSFSPQIRLGHRSENLANGTQRGVIQFDSIEDYSVNSGDAWKWKIATVARDGQGGNYNSSLEILRTTRGGVTDNTDFSITRTGNIGVGIVNPEQKLHVYDSADTVPVRIHSGGSDSSIGFKAAGDAVTYNTRCGSYQGSGFGVWTANTIRGIIDNSGNFGVGTISPLQKLDVRGNFLLAADGTTSTHITQKPYTINNGTLSWEGSAGQLFSITNNLTSGSIFSVNDVSGIPSIDVDANGTILFAPYGGNIGVGTLTPAQKLHVVGNSIVSGNLGLGIDSALAKLHVRPSTPAGLGGLPSGATGIFDSSGNNYLLFRNTGDNGTYSGIAMQDNNLGGYVIFGNAGGGGDLMYVAGYGGGQLQYGTADSINPAARTTVASWNSTGLQINSGDLRAPIFYDSNDTGYYVNPSERSRFVALETNGGTYNLFRTWTDLPGYHGLYSSVHNNAHFYPNNGSYGSWRIDGTRDGWRGLNFENAVVLMMNDNESGHHRNGYGWQFRWNDGTMYCHKSGQGGGTSATMWDSSNAPRAGNSNLMYYQGFTLDANTMDTNATGFTYSVNAPYTGPIVRFSTGSGAGYDLWLNSPYNGNGYGLAFRTRNGDTGSLNSWQYPAVYGVNVNGGGALYSTMYYDQNDTGYYLDPASTSVVNGIVSSDYIRIRGNKGIMGDYDTDGTASKVIWTIGASWPLGNMYGLGYEYGSGFDHHLALRNNGSTYSRFGFAGGMYLTGTGTATTDWRAPIFRDTDNTDYYLDPASTSDEALRIRGGALHGPNVTWGKYLLVGGNGRENRTDDSNVASVCTTNGNLHLDAASGYDTYINNYDGNNVYFGNGASGIAAQISSDGAFRAPIFRDYNDPTNYFVNPNGTSQIYDLYIVGGVGGISNSSIYHEAALEVRERGFGGAQDDTWATAPRIGFHWGGRVASQIALASNGRISILNNPGNALENFQCNDIFSSSIHAAIFRDSNDTNYYIDPASTSNIKNIQIEPQSASWAEGIQFYMPSSTTWGGVRWVRNRTNYNGSWYIGYTALDATDDIVFGCQNSGTQIDNIMRLYNSALGSATQGVRVSRDLYVSGNTSGNYGNRLVVGNTDTSYTLQDGSFRPTIQAHGQYPVVSLNNTATNNNNHGPTLQFTCNGTGNQFVIGTNGYGTFLSMGYSNAGDWNPHNGIAGHNGTSFFHANSSGYIGLGAQGDWSESGGSGSNVPGYHLHFIGSNNAINGHAALFDNRVNAANNGSGFLFRNLYSNHSWGIVAEYRMEANGGTDRPSILFSTGYNSNTWSVGFGYTDDNFRIKYDHGHRNSGWGTSALEIDRSSNVWAFGSVRSPIFRDQDDPTNYYVDPSGTSRFVALETVGGTYNVFRTWTDLPNHAGFYSSVHNNAHFYPNNGSYGSWRIEGTRNGWRGLNFEDAVVLMMNDNESGHHRNGYGWQFRWNDGTMYCHKNGQGGGTSATMWDSSNAPRASNSQLMYYQGFTLDANTMDTNATGFTYSVNAPYTGPIVRFSTGSGAGYDLWLNSPYNGNGYGLAFRTRNGDTGSLNSWQYPAVYGVNVNGGGALYSTIYYDQNDAGYYCDPNGTSRIGGIEIGSPSNTSNEIRFRGVNGDNPGGYDHAAIIERIWNTTDQSELLIFKGNDPDTSTIHDRIRIAATGRIVFDSYNGYANLTDYINARGTGNINGSMYINGNDVYVTGNVTATNYYGNGSNLTGITAGATLTNDTSTNATWYPTLSSSTSGTYTTAYVSNTKLTFNPSTGTLSATIFTSLSDETQKTNIEKITSAVDLTRQINGVKFEWKENGEKSAGVIAQEVEKIMPEIVNENDDGIKTVNYNGLVAVLIEALKEQQEQIDELKKAIKTHK